MRIIQKDGNFNVYLPKNVVKSTQFHKIKLKSELSNFTYTLEKLIDNDNLSDYYKFTIDFSKFPIPNGEYVYTVDDGDACGLLILGDVKSTVNNIEYVDKDNNKYIVYDND